MDDLAVRLAEVDQRGKSNTHRIDDLEKRADTLQELTTSVKLLAANMERMASEQMKQGDRLTALEKQPGERWNSMTRTNLHQRGIHPVRRACGGTGGNDD